MGNQLQPVGPTQILPVEFYLGGIENNFVFETSLGSTRFLKVARARSNEGVVVVKVFVRHNYNNCLSIHEERLERIKVALASAVNCLTFKSYFVSDRAGFIVREYVKHNLYDRISTRPFLTNIEKKWITFQILCALHQAHKQKICHGDIKLENILVTSWNWVLLTDFASFKPVFLVDNNPADYNYFFDTSRRRNCSIAPERFINASNVDPSHKDSASPNDLELSFFTHLTPEMDIFSAGCTILELWNDGMATFDYSQLLGYRSGKTDVINKHISYITDSNLQNMIMSMINIDPRKRKSAEIYLSEMRSILFPEYFYTFLLSFVQIFSAKTADEKINSIYPDVEQIKNITSNSIDSEDGTILLVSIVTSCIRGLVRCKSKIKALYILQVIGKNSSSHIILDRIIPFVLHLTNDLYPKIRVKALNTLTNCLSFIKTLPRTDVNIFPEYILPSIAHLFDDSAVVVRVAYAKNIKKLAEMAIKFLDQAELTFPDLITNQRYEIETNALHELFQQATMSLLTDQQSIVKQALLESGVAELCEFFGRQKANDIILSHMITFLNDKEDKNLRGSFFDCIVDVAKYIGWHCTPILIPLLEQGLTDPEEHVITKAIKATTNLAELDLIHKSALTDYVKESSCYLNHPNIWIRHEMCGLISVASKKLSPLDVQCKIMPILANYLKTSLIQIEKPEYLLNNLHTPLNRNIFDTIVKCSDVNTFYEMFLKKDINIEGAASKNPSLLMLYRRIKSEGYNEVVEMQLVSLRKFITKLNKCKSNQSLRVEEGLLNLSAYKNVTFEISLKKDACAEQLFSLPLASEMKYHDRFESAMNSNFSIQYDTFRENKMIDEDVTSSQVAECRKNLNLLINRMKTQYLQNSSFNEEIDTNEFSANWKLKGQNIAHLNEHKGSIIKMANLKHLSNYFLSASTDGSIRLWDCGKLDGQHSINRSEQTYIGDNKFTSFTVCQDGKSLVAADDNGKFIHLKVNVGSSKMLLENVWPPSTETNNSVVEMLTLNHGFQNIIVYCNIYGAIVGHDLRMANNAWMYECDLKKGIPTTMCADSKEHWLAIGTSSGWHVCWDMRFGIPIHGAGGIKHPYESRIRKLAQHPMEPSWLISASQRNNEILTWNIETQHRQFAFNVSTTTTTATTTHSHYVSAITTGIIENEPFILSGGSDSRIRCWYFNDSNKCQILAPSSADSINKPLVSYESHIKDGTKFIQETELRQNIVRNEEVINKYSMDFDTPSVGHQDSITDLLFCKTDKQLFVASSSQDGIIKLWK